MPAHITADYVSLFLETGHFAADDELAKTHIDAIWAALPADADKSTWGSILNDFDNARNSDQRDRARRAAAAFRDVIDARP